MDEPNRYDELIKQYEADVVLFTLSHQKMIVLLKAMKLANLRVPWMKTCGKGQLQMEWHKRDSRCFMLMWSVAGEWQYYTRETMTVNATFDRCLQALQEWLNAQ